MKSVCIFLLLATCIPVNGQLPVYTIYGEIKKISTGKIFLYPALYEKKYYDKNNSIDSAKIYNGRFTIQRKMRDKFPHAYRFFLQTDSLEKETGLVFIESGNQYILIDSVNEYVSPIIKHSGIQNEMKYEYEPHFMHFVNRANEFEKYADQLYQRYGKDLPRDDLLTLSRMQEEITVTSDSLFLEYVKRHPDSYVSLWKLIERFNNLGYKDQYSAIYNLLSGHIKSTPAAKLFYRDFNEAAILAINKTFPAFCLVNTKYETINFNINNYKANYILIDFWFSHCGPCVRQFPELKNIYADYKKLGFEIIGISVDKSRDFNDWQKVIRDKELNWIHFADDNGQQVQKWNINSFPTNFLLDEKGKIIKKNISPEELEYFLARLMPLYKENERVPD